MIILIDGIFINMDQVTHVERIGGDVYFNLAVVTGDSQRYVIFRGDKARSVWELLEKRFANDTEAKEG